MREGEVLLSKISQKYVVSIFTITKCNAMQLWDAVGGGGEGGLKVVDLYQKVQGWFGVGLTSQGAALLLHVVGQVLGQDLNHGLDGFHCISHPIQFFVPMCLTLEASLCMELFLWCPLGRSPNMSQDSS